MGELFGTFGINGPLLLTQAVNFGIALLVLWFFLFKPLMKVIAERRDKIAQGVADADAAAKKVEEVERERAGIITKAEREAEDAVAKGVEEGKKERAGIVERAQSQSDTILSDARAQAKELERRAQKEAEKQIAQTAILAAEKILSSK